MILPKRIRVGEHWYEIREKSLYSYLGDVCYLNKIIRILTGRVGTRKRSFQVNKKCISETFWHELTHAILYDMGDTTNNNEEFVTAFAIRLNEAILSAEF